MGYILPQCALTLRQPPRSNPTSCLIISYRSKGDREFSTILDDPSSSSVHSCGSTLFKALNILSFPFNEKIFLEEREILIQALVLNVIITLHKTSPFSEHFFVLWKFYIPSNNTIAKNLCLQKSDRLKISGLEIFNSLKAF